MKTLKPNIVFMRTLFKNQITEDLKIIEEEFVTNEPKLAKPEYAFNYWILSRIYNVDDELIPTQITDYNDSGIDCYVHYEDSKELFIIQNKYYDDNTPLDRKYVSDFLTAPLAALKAGKYKRSKDLQNTFDRAIEDEDYKIYLHMYVTNNKSNTAIDNLFSQFNINENGNKISSAIVRSEIFYLDKIYDLYYGKAFEEQKKFQFELSTINKGTILRVLPNEYKLEGMSPAHYIMTPLSVIYRMYSSAQQKGYPLFEENIREYLGRSPINNGIMRTLRSEEDRKNFFYYNNGITIICEKAESDTGTAFKLNISQPQVVNGCQTVNTIYEVLNDYAKKDIALIDKEFGSVYVMVKVLIFNTQVSTKKPNFYKDIVRFTNSQNAINEKAFASDKEIFSKLQQELENRGFILLVQHSDKHKFKEKYKDKAAFNSLVKKANRYSSALNLDLTTFSDVTIQLEKLLQVYLAFMLDGYYAYSKKSKILNPQSEYYNNYSLKMHDNFTYDNLLRLYLIHKKAEVDRTSSPDKKTPIPYYLIGFLGHITESRDNYTTINSFFNKLFELKQSDITLFYNFFSDLTNAYKIAYKQSHNEEYNTMIKQKIDEKLVLAQVDFLLVLGGHKEFKRILHELKS
ncbi:hypothetical protein CAP35_09110 [Chitinophagaceae bacterium IBVUCB1]|nr:hypothetical protein CAP35_09110 [Chitinophagaceae bacterium IBVUCB1]